MPTWTKFRDLPWWWQALVWVAFWPLPLALWAAALPRDRRLGPALLAAGSLAVWVAVAVDAAQPAPRPEAALDSSTSTTTDAGRPKSTATSAPDNGTSTSTPTTLGASDPADPGESSTTSRPAGSTSTTATTGPTTPTTTHPPATTATTGPTTTTIPTRPVGDEALLAALRVAPEGAPTNYSRDFFPDWYDADGDRCDTREEVLIAESTSLVQRDLSSCKVLAGDWLSLYDGLMFSDPSELHIDHVVALAEAWRSGAWGWDAARRRAFANDLDHPEALRAVSASSNLSKSDHDPSDWKPPREAAWCEYARDWITVKVSWDLGADADEVADLRVMLSTCPA